LKTEGVVKLPNDRLISKIRIDAELAYISVAMKFVIEFEFEIRNESMLCSIRYEL